MSEVRATVSFLAKPQLIEVFYGGVWRPGVLLGWRHDADESCHIRVSALVGGLKHTAWIDLAAARLPQPPARTDPATTRDPGQPAETPRPSPSRKSGHDLGRRPVRPLLVPPRPVALSPVRPRPRPHRMEGQRSGIPV